MKQLYLALMLLMSLSQQQLFAQNSVIKSYKTALYFGARNDTRDSLPNTADLDFANYLDESTEYPAFHYLGLSSQVVFQNGFETYVRLDFLDSPFDIELTTRYFPTKHLGLNASFSIRNYYSGDFTAFHRINDPDLFCITESNYTAAHLSDREFSLGVNVMLNFWRIRSTANLNAGYSAFKPISERIEQKQTNGNFRRNVSYDTKLNFDFFVYPQFEFNFDLIKFKTSALGLQFKTSYFLTQKSIDYTRTIAAWTANNQTIQHIDNPKHNLSSITFDFGLFLRKGY